MSLVSSFDPASEEGQPERYLDFVRVVKLLVESDDDELTNPEGMAEQLRGIAWKVVGYPGCFMQLYKDLDRWLLDVEVNCEQSRTLL